jgi:hypothetical protein
VELVVQRFLMTIIQAQTIEIILIMRKISKSIMMKRRELTKINKMMMGMNITMMRIQQLGPKRNPFNETA